MDGTSNRTYDLGQRLRKLRKSKRMTQKQAAKRLNVSPSTISGYEGNIKTPSLDLLIKLAHLYNVSTDYLLGMENRHMINIEGLTPQQTFLIEETIDIFKRKNAGRD